MQSKKTILVIDNDKDYSFLIKTLLSNSGYEVIVVPDGYNGVIKAKKIRPGCILLDMRMPAMSGLDILGQLKSDEDTSRIPIIILTGFENDKIKDRALELKATDYLVKPIEFEVLRKRIALALNES